MGGMIPIEQYRAMHRRAQAAESHVVKMRALLIRVRPVLDLFVQMMPSPSGLAEKPFALRIPEKMEVRLCRCHELIGSAITETNRIQVNHDTGR